MSARLTSQKVQWAFHKTNDGLTASSPGTCRGCAKTTTLPDCYFSYFFCCIVSRKNFTLQNLPLIAAFSLARWLEKEKIFFNAPEFCFKCNTNNYTAWQTIYRAENDRRQTFLQQTKRLAWHILRKNQMSIDCLYVKPWYLRKLTANECRRPSSKQYKSVCYVVLWDAPIIVHRSSSKVWQKSKWNA